MRVLVLSPYPEKIAPIIETAGDTIVADGWEKPGVDFVVSYGHKTIIREPMLSEFFGRIINLHISFLPWNRGADPNLWSWVEHSPKGVTVHFVDSGIDTGPIIAQRSVAFSPDDTLASSYDTLQTAVLDLFAEFWPHIKNGSVYPFSQGGHGSLHKLKDKDELWRLLPFGYDTPVKHLEEMNSEIQMNAAFQNKVWA